MSSTKIVECTAPKKGGVNMAEKVQRVGVRREEGWLYFVDRSGDVARARMSRAGRRSVRGKVERVARAGVRKEKGFLYFVDKQGDVSRAKMARGRRRSSSAARRRR